MGRSTCGNVSFFLGERQLYLTLDFSRASQFYLVIDVSNLTSQEMSLNYTENKNILIEAQESCRVPIPVDRCEVDESVLRRSDELVENENGK